MVLTCEAVAFSSRQSFCRRRRQSHGRNGKSQWLVEELPDSELEVAKRYLEYLRNTSVDPVVQAIARAPYDDERVTSE